MPPEVLDLFVELAALPSPPGDERAVADLVTRYLDDCGLAVDEDDTGAETGSTMGNLYTRLEPTGAGEPLFLCAHLDTVPPTAPIEPVVEDGIVRNAGGTILGADDKAAVAVDARRRSRACWPRTVRTPGSSCSSRRRRRSGLSAPTRSTSPRLSAKLGYVYDQAAPIGTIILGAPFSRRSR